MFSMKRTAITALAAVAVMLLPAAHASKRGTDISSDDETFLALRDASRAGNVARATELAARLPQYPIPSYVDYYSLRPRINVAPESEIRDYLARYAGSAIADRLRNDWLLELGRQRNWALFDEQYPLFALDDDTQVRCYALMSKTLQQQATAEAARRLLVSPAQYGEACPALIATLVESGQFNMDDAWAQAHLVAETAQPAVLRRLAPVLQVPDETLTQAYSKPDRVVRTAPGRARAAKEVFLLAVGRLARSDPQRAAASLEKHKASLTKAQLAGGWARIALPASRDLAPEAAEYWKRAEGAPLSNEAHEWKARIALREGNWKRVREIVSSMPDSLRSEGTWIYWLGRAYAAQGNTDLATQLYTSIADRSTFYGKLALEEMGQPITVPPRTAPVTAEELAPMATNAGLRRALKFFEMNLRFEGVREWNWELRAMNERQLLAAAEFARHNAVLDRMVNTSDRTRIEFDFTQRFPTPFRDAMATATDKLGLDMAWVYGLIRQESRFIMDARSHVGASGLMQLMPATARWVARKIGMSDFKPSQVNELETNLTLGTNYLNMVLQDLDGSQALATAAYNAGPGRSRRWRASLPGEVEGAVFAELIPFSETRDYVKKVLSNATYYAALFEDKPQSLKARLGTVAPRDFAPTELP